MDIEKALLEAGEVLPDDVALRIIDLDEAAVPALLPFVQDVELTNEDAPGEGWAPIHAVELLTELKAVEAIEPMLQLLAETDPLSIVHDRLLTSLPSMGAAVLEPALAAHAQCGDAEVRSSLCSVLCKLGVRDERVFRILVRSLEFAPDAGASDLSQYGDPRAIPHLRRTLDRTDVEPDTGPFSNQVIVELYSAIEELGGVLSPAQEAKKRQVGEQAREFRRMLTATARKLGRNEPCWCGSGKKYKKCHLRSDGR